LTLEKQTETPIIARPSISPANLGPFRNPMRRLSPLVLCFPLVLACGGSQDGSRVAGDNPTGRSRDAQFARVILIQCPVEYPPPQRSLVIDVDGSDIDEQDTDELSKPSLSALPPCDLLAAASRLSPFSLRPHSRCLPQATVFSVLRC
jgi:hypothetical protein